MNPAPRRIINLKIEKFEIIDFFFREVIYLIKRGVG